MFCPKCKTEYREDFTICADCGEVLARELLKDVTNEFVPADWQHLITVADDMEAAMIASFLDAENIPVFKKAIGVGGYLQVSMGQTRLGIKILVPKDCLERAREIIEAFRETELLDSFDDEDFEELRESKSRVYMKAIILFFVIPALMWLIVYIISNLGR